jgi:hypothetical protein
MAIKSKLSVCLLAGLFAVSAEAAKAPFNATGYTYVMLGDLKVRGAARCGGFAGGGGGKSKVPMTASVRFDPDDAFFWFDDSMALADSYGQVMKRNKNGQKLELAFNGGQAATALFQMAAIPNSGNPTGMDIAASYSLKAAVSAKKATVTEKAVYKYKIAMCTYKYTITRKMSGVAQPPA